MKFVFFGTSEFGAIILTRLVKANLSPVLTVTTPDKPVGRKQELTPSPVKVVAAQYNLLVFQPPDLIENAYVQTIRQANADLFVLSAYGKILPQAILNIPKLGALNVHPSLLPKYRGPSPMQYAVLEGEERTGVSIILMDEEVDHGPIIQNSTFEILNPKITYSELHNQLAELGAKLLIEIIPLWVEGKIKPAPQDHATATFTKKIEKEDGRIDWNKEAEYIERQVRALYPWPGTYTKFEIPSTKSETNSKFKMLKILKASVLAQDRPLGKPGQAFPSPIGGVAVQTNKDALFLEELQMEGGKPMSSKEFLLGYKDFLGTILS